jgi:hypothetical protein
VPKIAVANHHGVLSFAHLQNLSVEQLTLSTNEDATVTELSWDANSDAYLLVAVQPYDVLVIDTI